MDLGAVRTAGTPGYGALIDDLGAYQCNPGVATIVMGAETESVDS